MTGLGVKGNGNKVPLFWNIRSHLPNLKAYWLTPISFFGLVVLGNARHEFFQASCAANPSGGGYYDLPVPRGNGDLLTHRKMRFFEHLLRQTQPLAISPLLNFGHDVDTS